MRGRRRRSVEVRRASGFSLLSLFSFAFSFSISSPSRSSRPFKAATKEEGKGLARMSRASRERERERGERSEGLASIVRSRLSFNFCVTLLWVELSCSLLCEGFCCSLFRILANRQKSFFPFFFSSVISILYRYCFLFFVSFLF